MLCDLELTSNNTP